MPVAQGLLTKTCVLLTSLVLLLKPTVAFSSFFSPRGLYCSLTECCEEEKPYNSTAMLQDLNTKLFEQHLAHEIIFKALTGFLSNESPEKPLALSMHGWSGIGKSHVAKIIVKNIYKLGMESKLVHLFLPELHFPNKNLISKYKVQLQSWIRGNVSNCARSIFIFDEMDKLHPGLINAIKPFLDYHDNIDGVSYRKAIFLFLSNQDGNLINKKAMEYWKTGKEREEIKLQDLESGLSLELYNNLNSGFGRSTLIKQNMIDFFIPFLPLERRHVEMCIKEELRRYGQQEDRNIIDTVADMLQYDPKEYKLFSVSGCKHVPSRVTLVLKPCHLTTPPSCQSDYT
ncbi:torsin-1A-like [Pseudophryne corroboree]|uniref:torsin-1A-like n=1 Tax=Pseudophryne corroboree TaxID=495146 RepID=UPI00308137CD